MDDMDVVKLRQITCGVLRSLPRENEMSQYIPRWNIHLVCHKGTLGDILCK